MSQFTNFSFNTKPENLVEFLKTFHTPYTVQQTKTADFYRVDNLRIWARTKSGYIKIDGSLEQDSERHDEMLLAIIHNPSFYQVNISL